MATAKKKTAKKSEPTPGTEDFDLRTVDEATEVAGRSQDVHEESTTTHRKVFVVPTAQKALVNHEANEVALRNALIQQGLRATGDISHTLKDNSPSEGSTAVIYTVEATVAGDNPIEVESQSVYGEPGGEDAEHVDTDPAKTEQ